MTQLTEPEPWAPAPDAANARGRRALLGTRTARPLRFGRHLGETVAAMMVGMLALDPLWSALFGQLGPVAHLAVTTADMTVAMAVWMRYRGHSWRLTAEMSAAMAAPAVLLLAPTAAGVLAADAAMMAAHTLMLPAMIGAMLVRLPEYTGSHGAGTPARTADPAGTAGGGGGAVDGLVSAVARRWPAWLGLGMGWLMAPDGPISPWSVLVLPGGYLLIGGVRRTLGSPGILAVQLAGLAAYVALALAAIAAVPQVAVLLVGLGWLVHAGWDVVHHRLNRVVPRGYAQCCAVVDVIVGISVLSAL
jgi:hypothetical protein